MQNGSLRSPGPDPSANALEILQDYRPLRAFGFRNDLLRYYVVGVRGKAALFARQLAQAALGGTRLFLLQLPAQSAVPMAHRADLTAAVPVAVGIAGDVNYSEIDP